MVIASDYPFLDVFWTILIFFAWVIWIWMVIVIFTDIFRRDDIGGWSKAAWIVFIIVIPFLGVLVYLIAQHDGMTERRTKDIQAQQQQMDSYIKSVAGEGGGSAAEIAQAKQLLDSGAISQQEFDTLKAKALAT